MASSGKFIYYDTTMSTGQSGCPLILKDKFIGIHLNQYYHKTNHWSEDC
jgi:hypothetical protein